MREPGRKNIYHRTSHRRIRVKHFLAHVARKQHHLASRLGFQTDIKDSVLEQAAEADNEKLVVANPLQCELLATRRTDERPRPAAPDDLYARTVYIRAVMDKRTGFILLQY
jgi:hypothetical protein